MYVASDNATCWLSEYNLLGPAARVWLKLEVFTGYLKLTKTKSIKKLLFLINSVE